MLPSLFYWFVCLSAIGTISALTLRYAYTPRIFSRHWYVWFTLLLCTSSAIVAGITYICALIFRNRFKQNRRDAMAVLLMLMGLISGFFILFVYDSTRLYEMRATQFPSLEGDLTIEPWGMIKARIHNGTNRAVPEITVLIKVVRNEAPIVALNSSEVEFEKPKQQKIPKLPPGYKLERSPAVVWDSANCKDSNPGPHTVPLEDLDKPAAASQPQQLNPEAGKVITTRVYRLTTTSGLGFEDSDYIGVTNIHLGSCDRIVWSIVGAKWGR